MYSLRSSTVSDRVSLGVAGDSYAKWWQKPDGSGWVQMVFQCRVNPQYISVVGQHTCGNAGGIDHPVPGNTIDPNIDNADMEWLVKPNGRSAFGDQFLADDQIVCYGIFLREAAQKPTFPN